MKRRLIAAFLVTAMVMTAAVGCGNSGSDDSGKEDTKTETDGGEEGTDADTDAASDTGYSERKVTLVTSGTGEPQTVKSNLDKILRREPERGKGRENER